MTEVDAFYDKSGSKWGEKQRGDEKRNMHGFGCG